MVINSIIFGANQLRRLKKVLIVISILLLAGAGYFTYEKWVKHSNLTLWSFIPADAAFVVEGKVTENLSLLKSYPIWDVFDKSSGFKTFQSGLSFLDSINGNGGFTALFEETPALVSGHKVSSNRIDFLFVVKLKNISQNTFANAAIGRLKKQGYRFRTRNYNDFRISEISSKNKTLTFIFYKNFFLASFTPYLIEDAVRAISNTQILSFKEKFTTLSNPNDATINLYVNYGKTADLLSAFATGRFDLPFISGSYAFAVDSSTVQITGFSKASESWSDVHNNQPASFEMAEVVPENTAFFHHITSTDFKDWKSSHIETLRSNNPSVKKIQDSLKLTYDFNSDQVFDLIKDEVGIAYLESPRARDEHKLFILEVNDIQETLSFFSQLTSRIALARGDSIYTESYSENEIKFLPIYDFPFILFGDQAKGFEQSFYVNYRNYLIFSNDLQQLKNLVRAIQEENTWGKSIRMNDFLQRTNNTANVSLYINVPRAWNKILSYLKPQWSEHFKKNAETYRSIELAAFQFSYLDGQFFTNYTLTQPVTSLKNIPKTRPDDGIRFISKLTTKPYLLKTHAHRNFDMIIQDSTNTIYYLDPSQNALWTKELDGQVVGNIYPIDYYKNGKIQYVLATRQQVHIIDRTGVYIPGFPKKLPNASNIDHINLIDYDLSRNYRIAITNIDGNIFLADKDLKLLDGWSPKQFERPALLPLTHKRLGRKDVMISVQENGVINLMNRRGEFMRGTPFDTRQSLDKNYFIRSSNSLANSSMTIISKGGELTEINLEGDVIKREQLLKTSVDASFKLISDTGEDSFIIIRKENSTYDVLDDTGNLLFQKNYLSQGPILIQYYQFGAGKDLIIFVDQASKTLYIYDKSGNLITGNPLNSEHEVSLIYSSAKREFQVFTTWDTNLELYTFSY